MTVVDASAVVQFLLYARGAVLARLTRGDDTLHAPHFVDLEILQTLSRFQRAGLVSDTRTQEALSDLAVLTIVRHPHGLLLPRIWELRANFTAYDASYVALAEWLEAPLLTHDAKFARTPGHRATIELI